MSSAHDIVSSGAEDPVEALRGLDLNLLVAFDTLLRTGSVTAAAGRAGVTQSAMSHTLRRLRLALHDPLLVRAGSTMVPTPRAEALREPVRGVLVALSRALATPDGFDPATANRTFRMVSPDLFDLLLVPRLMAELAQVAPGVDLTVGPLRASGLAAELLSGEVDLAIQPLLGSQPIAHSLLAGGLVRQKLFSDVFACFVRPGHPGLNGDALSLEAFLAFPHILVSPSGRGPGLVDSHLASIGRSRRVGLRIPQFAVAPSILAATDLVLTAPRSLAAATETALVTVAPPLDLPHNDIALVWHERFSEEPGHRWFRALLRERTASWWNDVGIRP